MRVTLCDNCGNQIVDGAYYVLLLKKVKEGLYYEDVTKTELCEDCAKEVMRTLGDDDC